MGSTIMTAEQRLQLEELKKLESQEKERTKEDRQTLKEMTDESVKDAFAILLQLSKNIKEAKTIVYSKFADIIELKKQVYQTSDEQFSHTFTTKDSKLRIMVGYHVVDSFDDSHTAGVDGVNEYLNSMGTDDDSKWLVKTIKKYISRNTKGELNAKKVMELMQLANERGDQLLIDKVQIIVDAYTPIKTKLFIMAKYRDDKQNEWKTLPLGITEANMD
ncbi:DUF3164 family protein [Labilibaculum sp.]|uniref:DUF3164 family protein n=1 Tax=Labilibaculum sp. TaxID=2060723 RepID=UPI002AA7CC26|nr:DUF3164 family protein [Labilibaculum sp.]